MMIARVLIAAVLALFVTPAAAETLHGLARLDQRIALPEGLVFEAVIADTARADAPAIPLAATRFETSGQPPFAFAIDYDPAALIPGAHYTLRATLHREGLLFATTDTVIPVLQGGPPGPMVLTPRHVADRSGGQDAAGPLAAHGLRLPASFRGTLPCANCAGVRHQLDLWPDQVYALGREWLGGRGGAVRRDEMGLWYADPLRGAVVLHGASEMPLYWQVTAPDRLRQMDMQGAPLVSDPGHDLLSEGFVPADLTDVFMAGEASLGPDGAAFRDCLTGRSFALSGDADFPALAAELAAGGAGPLLVNLSVAVTWPRGLSPQRARVTVLRFNAAYPGERCPRPSPTAALTDTYWRIVVLAGAPVPVLPNRREPHLVLHGQDRRFAATVGCNRLLGGFTLPGDRLSLAPAASTLMACPPPLDTAERRLVGVLEGTAAFRQTGETLELLGAGGEVLAVLEAVYLR